MFVDWPLTLFILLAAILATVIFRLTIVLALMVIRRRVRFWPGQRLHS